MALITCPECGREISNSAHSCPHCGYPLSAANPSPTPSSSSGSEKKRSSHIPLISIIILSAFACVALLWYSSTALSGNDKAAYELILQASVTFKDPSSVRLVSGRYNQFFGLDCCISATNSYGARTTLYYQINTDGKITASYDYSVASSYNDKTSLNIDKINRALEKALSLH